MLGKIIIVFLCAMVLVGMIGKLLFPSAASKRRGAPAIKCAHCGKPQIGRGRCSCGGGQA